MHYIYFPIKQSNSLIEFVYHSTSTAPIRFSQKMAGLPPSNLVYGRIHLPHNMNLMDKSSIKRAIDKNFLFCFSFYLMKLVEVVIYMIEYYNFTKFQQNRMKNK